MSTGVKKPQGVPQNQDFLSLRDVFFLENLGRREKRVVRSPVFEVRVVVHESGDVHRQHIHHGVGMFPPEPVSNFGKGHGEGFTRYGSIFSPEVQVEGQELGLFPAFRVRMDHMLVGDEEYLPLLFFFFQSPDHQEPGSPFSPLVFDPDRGVDPGEGNGGTEALPGSENQAAQEKQGEKNFGKGTISFHSR